MGLSFHWEVREFQPSPAALSLFLTQFEVECESFNSALEYQSLMEEAQKMTATMVRTTPAIVLQGESLISICAFRGSSCITDSQTSAVPNRHKWRIVNRSVLVFLRDGDSRDAYSRDEVKYDQSDTDRFHIGSVVRFHKHPNNQNQCKYDGKYRACVKRTVNMS